MSPLAAVYFRSRAEYTALGVLRDTIGYLNFLVLIFVPAWPHAAENRSTACWRHCWEDPSMQYQFVRKNQMIHPAVPNSDTLVDASLTGYTIHIDQGTSVGGGDATASPKGLIWRKSGQNLRKFGQNVWKRSENRCVYFDFTKMAPKWLTDVYIFKVIFLFSWFRAS